METLVRYVGCLLGVAIGDALGYPVEFQRHGPFIVSGMTSPWYSDDTQMTLATTEGLIKSKETGNPTAEVYREYLRWLDSQSDPSQRRAPGGTCISALSSGQMGTVENKLNDSKGCGGVMRTAPAGLACLPNAAFRYGVETGRGRRSWGMKATRRHSKRLTRPGGLPSKRLPQKGRSP